VPFLAGFTGRVRTRRPRSPWPAEPNAFDSLGEGQLVAGDLEAAIESFTRAFEGGHPPARRMRGLTLAAMGRLDEGLADVAALEQGLPRAAFSPAQIALGQPLILAKMGRYREVQRHVEQSRGQAIGANPMLLAIGSLFEAWMALERNECGGASTAIEAADRALASITDYRRRAYQVFSDLMAGTCLARQGRLPDARARLKHAREVHAAGAAPERWWVAALEGEIALAAGDPAAADRAFAAGEPQRKMVFNRGAAPALTAFANNLALRDGRARAAAAQGNTEEAIRRYRELLTPGRDQKWTATFEPRYVLAIARLLDKVGRRDDARREYLRFLEYWKHADPGLPELVEARGRIS
jgi:tetratricopeptide (TPR) repeat protein